MANNNKEPVIWLTFEKFWFQSTSRLSFFSFDEWEILQLFWYLQGEEGNMYYILLMEIFNKPKIN